LEGLGEGEQGDVSILDWIEDKIVGRHDALLNIIPLRLYKPKLCSCERCPTVRDTITDKRDISPAAEDEFNAPVVEFLLGVHIKTMESNENTITRTTS